MIRVSRRTALKLSGAAAVVPVFPYRAFAQQPRGRTASPSSVT